MARPRPFRTAHIREHFSKRTQYVHWSLLRPALFVFLLQSFWSSGGSAYYCYFTFSLHFFFSLSPSPSSPKASRLKLRYACAQEWQIGDAKAKQTTIMVYKMERVGLHFKTHLWTILNSPGTWTEIQKYLHYSAEAIEILQKPQPSRFRRADHICQKISKHFHYFSFIFNGTWN